MTDHLINQAGVTEALARPHTPQTALGSWVFEPCHGLTSRSQSGSVNYMWSVAEEELVLEAKIPIDAPVFPLSRSSHTVSWKRHPSVYWTALQQ